MWGFGLDVDLWETFFWGRHQTFAGSMGPVKSSRGTGKERKV